MKGLAAVEEGPDRGDHARSPPEERAYFRVHREIGVPLSIPLLRVGEPRMTNGLSVDDFFLAERQRTQRLGQQLIIARAHGDFAGARPEQLALDAHDVADIEQLQHGERVVAQLVLPEIDLDASGVVRDVGERGLPVTPPCNQPARDPNRLPLFHTLRQKRDRVRRFMRPLVPVGVRLHAARNELIELFAPGLLDEVQVLRRFGYAGGFLGVLLHAAFVCCFRYASMNVSISPSMMRCTSGIFISVRWSFTIVYGWNT
jgi:hypothetical protein